MDTEDVTLAAVQALGKRTQLLLEEDTALRGELERVTRALALLARRYDDLTRHIEVQTRGARVTRIGLRVVNQY